MAPRDDKRQAERVKYGLPRIARLHTLAASSEIPLIPHASCPSFPVTRLAASARIDTDGSLLLHYRLAGAVMDIRWPSRCADQKLDRPTDDLWQHTCFEAFIAEGDGTAYREFNFSSSGEWANYRFVDYRERDEIFAPPAVPSIAFFRQPMECTLQVRIPAASLPAGRALAIGLTAVIETEAGDKRYWALSHVSPRPDFHPRASFTLLLNTDPT